MKSMTGYARVTAESNGRELTVELKAVNHRYLDVNTKLPRAFIAFEDVIRKTVAKKMNRGHIDVFINYTDHNEDSKQVILDVNLAKNILDAAKTLKENFELKDDFQLNALMRSGDVLTFNVNQFDEEEISAFVENTVSDACDKLNQMREAEGEKLENIIFQRLITVEKLTSEIKEYAPKVVTEYREKLTQRITEVLGCVEIDQARLINEVAFFADKASIDEEIDRIYCHIAQTKKLLKSNEAVGRKLDFLIQEFNREANTICSKSNNVNITGCGVELKNEIEKIREQIQNIE
ncbi:MAG TPA: YicC family protein [Eubacteriales bacterium]|nr:YicC family protein [Eubacteriales bacterium]